MPRIVFAARQDHGTAGTKSQTAPSMAIALKIVPPRFGF
jgi:hypothetical protein